MSSKEATKGGSSKVPTGSKTGHSKKIKESSSAIDSNLSQPPVSTPVDPGMHKEDQQVTGGLTSLGVTNEARANPQLSSGISAFNLNEPIYIASFIIHSKSVLGNDALAVSTAEADPRNSAPSDFVPQQQGAYQPGSHSPVSKHKLELEKNKAEAVLLKAQPSFPNVEQLKELLVKSLKTELSNILSTNDFSSSLPTRMKDIPSKLNELTGEVATVQANLKTLYALLGLLSHVTKALNKFAQVLVSASSKAGDKSVPLAGQADTMPAEGEKNTN
ncbi:hypothetical protein Tco_0740040 [Tanacetum coccineum]